MAEFHPDQFYADNPNSSKVLPSFWRRALVNGFIWSVLLGYLFLFLPQFFPIYRKLEEKGELPGLTRFLFHFVGFIADYSYVPVAIAAGLFITLDHFIAEKTRNGTWHRRVFLFWTHGSRFMCLVALVIAVRGTFFNLTFRNPSTQLVGRVARIQGNPNCTRHAARGSLTVGVHGPQFLNDISVRM